MRKKNKKSPKEHQLSLKDLIDVQEWQCIQDNFSIVTEVSLRTLDTEGNCLTSCSKEPRLCSELIKDSPHKEKICGSCLPTFLGGKGVVDKNLSFSCHAGLCNFITPLRANKSKILGYITLGPVILVKRKSKEQYRKAAEEFDIALEDFWNAILEIKVTSFQGMQSLIELIKDVGEYIIGLAYQKAMKEREVTMVLDSSKLVRLLNLLLDVAFQVTQADIGSIMFYDKKSDELTIRASRGLPEEIVNKTRLRLGEGIAGTAAKEKVSFLIDDNLKDNRIKRYLNRPYISSSMIIPIQVRDKVMGVINLGALETSGVRFNAENMRLMNNLISLATVALHE